MLQPGDKLKVVIDEVNDVLVFSPEKKEEDAKIVLTEWGFPVIHAPGEFPEDFNPDTAIKDSYEEYHKSRFGF